MLLGTSWGTQKGGSVWYLKQAAWSWGGGGTEEQCAPATKGGKRGRKHSGKEKTFQSPFCPVLAQTNICYARFAIVSRDKSCLSFLGSYVRYISLSYILSYYPFYIYIYIYSYFFRKGNPSSNLVLV